MRSFVCSFWCDGVCLLGRERWRKKLTNIWKEEGRSDAGEDERDRDGGGNPKMMKGQTNKIEKEDGGEESYFISGYAMWTGRGNTGTEVVFLSRSAPRYV